MLLRTLVCVVFLHAFAVQAATSSEQHLNAVGFIQKLSETIPADLVFRNQRDEEVAIRSAVEGKPTVLVMSWLECPNLCSMLLDNLATVVKKLPFGRDDYNVLVVSIDPRESPENSRRAIKRLSDKYGSIVNDWVFLTGEQPAIDSLSEAVGFRYEYDAEDDTYAHPAGFVVISPDGTVSRYMFRMEPSAPDMKLALLDAAEGDIGSPVDQIVLRCYRFDADSGRYNFAVMRVIQVVALIFIIAMVALVWWMRRRNARK